MLFRSEVDRIARRQISVTKIDSPYLFLSSEVVKYKSEAAAKTALSELIARGSECVTKGGGIESSGAFSKYVFTSFPGERQNIVTTSSSFFVHATIGEGANMRYLLGFYQYKGPFFTGVYVVRPAKGDFSQDEITRWVSVAAEMAQRLASKN